MYRLPPPFSILASRKSSSVRRTVAYLLVVPNAVLASGPARWYPPWVICTYGTLEQKPGARPYISGRQRPHLSGLYRALEAVAQGLRSVCPEWKPSGFWDNLKYRQWCMDLWVCRIRRVIPCDDLPNLSFFCTFSGQS